MPFFSLHPHPNHPMSSVHAVGVMLDLGGREARLHFEVSEATQVVWPSPAEPSRADDLWRTTCFELFLMLDDEERYVEFNFSPSGQWAAYAFDGYRDGRAALPMRTPPVVTRTPDGAEVSCSLADLPHGELRMGLAAVIEEVGGAKSYWAVAHPPGPPDFHNPACFAARLPPPRGA